jgi:Skp family chaperone for outer membrane proteins
VKRTVFVAAGALVLGLAICFCATTWAQPPASSTPTPSNAKSKVAMFNLTYVMKHYEKFKSFEAEMKATVKGYQTKDEQLKKQIKELAEAAQKPGTTPDQKERAQADIKAIQRKIQDNQEDFGKVVGKKQGDQLKILYMDVRNTVHRYAAAHGYDVVMHYNDAITSEEYYSGQNITRKMGAGALMPIYMGSGVDISQDIVLPGRGLRGQGARGQQGKQPAIPLPLLPLPCFPSPLDLSTPCEAM